LKKAFHLFGSILLIVSISCFPLLFSEPAYADCINSNQANNNAINNPPAVDESGTVTVTTQVTCGGDDISYRVAVPSSIIFAGVTYQAIYATTNSVITFGNADGTYWTYPNTPSLSIGSQDWVAYPSQYPDEHFIITTSVEGFQIDLTARPYGNQNTPTLTTIITTAIINPDTTLSITYLVDNLPDGTRTGARLPTGEIVTLEQAGLIQVEIIPPAPGEPTPTPTPEPTPTPTPEPTPTPTPEPTPTPTPTPEPTPPPILIPTYEPPPVAIPDPPIIIIDIPIEELPPLAPVDDELPPIDDILPIDDIPIIEIPPPEEPIIELPPIEELPIEELPIEELPIEEPLPEPMPVEETPPTTEEVINNALADGVLTLEEKTVVIDSLISNANGEPITAQTIVDAGLTYADLPPEQPVTIREDENGNEVTITAEIATALILLDNPIELVSTIFSNPAEAITALSNIGADMSTEERTESTKAVVATVIAAGAAINAVGTTTTRTPSSSPKSGGGGAVGKESVRRRKP